MNCLQAEENFSAHLEDALDYQSLQRFESHISECGTCQREYARFSESVRASQQLPQIEPSPYFMPTLQQRLTEEQRETLSIWQRLQHIFNVPKWAYGGIIILILATAGTFIYQDNIFNRGIQPSDGIDLISTTDSQDPVDNNDQLLPRGLGGGDSSTIMTTQPMQRHYILKQVSYTTASTAGGL